MSPADYNIAPSKFQPVIPESKDEVRLRCSNSLGSH